jgi:chorismate lyase / 3-hydroxybenzoate synthase
LKPAIVRLLRAPAGLHLDYVSPAEYRSARWADVLGVATFSGPPAPAPGAGEIPVAAVNTPVLLGTADVYEVWRSGQPAESGRRNRVRFRRSENLLFGCIALAESEIADELAAAPAAPSALHIATEQAYREICATLDALGYPHLLRIWNYLPDINRDSHGTERYRQFNRARHEALRACGRALAGNVPAASALGAVSGSPLVVYFLAGRAAPTFIENPRQMSAYRYPREYGTHRPLFSRATLLRQRDSLMLFISGTASIVGHRSIHVGDAAAQTRETLTNIEALLEEANRVQRGARFSLGTLACKVYVRRPQDVPLIRSQLAAALDPATRVIYLQADICRQDLLVEIEATGMCALKADA